MSMSDRGRAARRRGCSGSSAGAGTGAVVTARSGPRPIGATSAREGTAAAASAGGRHGPDASAQRNDVYTRVSTLRMPTPGIDGSVKASSVPITARLSEPEKVRRAMR
jgi:hypothetical protein